MSNVSACVKSESDICNLFRNMNLMSAVESDKTTLNWVKQYDGEFRGFVKGLSVGSDLRKNGEPAKFRPNRICDVTGKDICSVYTPADDALMSHATSVTRYSFSLLSAIPHDERSRILLRIAVNLEKSKEFFVNLEALSSGKHLSKIRSKDFPSLVESFRYYAGVALQLDSSTEKMNLYPQGPVIVVAEKHHNPLLTLSLRIGSLLASGNSVLLLCHWKSFLSAFLLAEVCYQSGIPPGVFNVVPTNLEKISIPQTTFSKLIFSGSIHRCVLYSRVCAEFHLPCEFLIPKRPVVVIYEDSDLHSAANGVLEAFFFHDTRSSSGGCKVMVQESINEKFMKILSECFEKILVGYSTSYSDMCGIVTEEQKKELSNYIEEAEKIKGKITRVPNDDNKRFDFCHIMPILISNLPTNFKLVHEELGGPVIVTTLFRTVKESVSMFNCDNRGSPVSIWTEKISVALEVASKLKTGTVWVNSQNLVDPAVPFSGIYMSGNSVEGGKDGCFSHMSPVIHKETRNEKLVKYDNWFKHEKLPEIIFPELNKRDEQNHPEDTEKNNASTEGIKSVKKKMKEYKLFIGGDLIRSGNSLDVLDDSTAIPSAKESDVQKAVSSALAAQPEWERRDNSQRRKVVFAIYQQLMNSRGKVVRELQEHTSFDENAIYNEVEQTLDLLHHWSVKIEESCDQEMKKNVVVLQKRCPRGVIGIQCPDANPLLSFVSLVISAVIHGNSVVAIASSVYPTVALRMSELFLSADVPAGVINTVCGNKTLLVPALCKHNDVNAIWFTDAPIKVIYANCNVTQRIFNSNDIWNNINEAKSFKYTLESTFAKAIYLPFGEVFAN